MSKNIATKHVIYKQDRWNMMNLEVRGKEIVVSEISEEWGEDTYVFLSRPALMQWAENKFSAEKFEGTEEQRQEILDSFRNI